MNSILSRVGVSARRMQSEANAILVASLNESIARPTIDLTNNVWRVIEDRHQIQHVLRDILNMQREVTLTGQSQQRIARSRIVAIDRNPDGHFLIERVADDSAHTALLGDGRITLGSRFLELPIVCAVDISQSGEIDGKHCYRIPLPNWILFSEVREAWRVSPQKATPVRLRCNRPGQPAITARVIDISEGGIGLSLPQHLSFQPTASECWDGTLLSDTGESIALALNLRHVTGPFSNGSRIGATIHPRSSEDVQSVRQLIVRHQLPLSMLA